MARDGGRQGEGREGGCFSLICATAQQTRGGPALPHPCPSGLAHPQSLTSSATFTMFPRQRAGPAPLSAAAREGQGQPSRSYDLRASSLACCMWLEIKEYHLSLTHVPATETVLLCRSGEVQGLLSQVLQLVKGGRVSFPALMPATDCKGRGGRRVSLPHPDYQVTDKW